MVRKTITDPGLRPLVDGLVASFLTEGSVNAVHRRLADALAGHGGKIYPNRLHALLSDDSGRAVNPQTIETVAVALDRLGPGLVEEAESRSAPLRARVLAAWDAIGPGAGDGTDEREAVHRLAADLAVPAAVVRKLLEDARRIGPAVRHRTPTAAATPESRRAPDWSFQDDAYRAAVRSLRADPNRKAGLVIPTGGGKTRVAVRILLRILADSPRADGVVLWVTHRRFLGVQARRELQRALNEGTPDLPEDAVKLLTERVHVTMVADLALRCEAYGERIVLVVVDEAHHAAARSYAPIFERRPLRGLFLTATPNRTDGRGIGVDEIAYTITYRQLFHRGVLVEPSFEDPLVVSGAGWDDPSSLDDLADYVVERAQTEFVKTMVVASRVDHVLGMHAAIARALGERERIGGHVLGPDDVGFVHGGGSSTGARPDEFLDEFIALPRGVLVTTAQMLGEGFDDPAVNAVIVTYPTASMIQLMQAAGRCLRQAPGKQRAFVVQVKESHLAYHYEQRWLYQDISDALRPQLVDRVYASRADLDARVEQLLDAHRIDAAVRASIRERLGGMTDGETFALLLTGLPFRGDASRFAEEAEWSAVPVTAETRDLFVRVFNGFSDRVGEVKFAGDFLRDYVDVDPAPGSTWSCLRDMLTAMEYARREIDREPYWAAESRGYQPSRGTTWLTYVTFGFEPVVPVGLRQFLVDTVNREEVLGEYTADPGKWRAFVKIALPLGGSLAFVLDAEQTAWLERERNRVVDALRDAPPRDAFARLEAWRVMLAACPLPLQLVLRFENFLSADALAANLYRLDAEGSLDAEPAAHTLGASQRHLGCA